MSTIKLRPVLESDVTAFFEHQNDRVAQDLAVFGGPNYRDREAFLARWQGFLVDPSMVSRTVVTADTIAGYVAHFEQLGKPSVSYWIDRSCWGQGIATEAVRQFMDVVQVRPLYARVAASNVGSVAVLEKNGFCDFGREYTPLPGRAAPVEELLYKLI